jgi:signal transduction histidine kinase
VPQAELSRIQAVNQAALAGDRQVTSRYDAPSQILLLTACPLPGPIPNLTAWTMTRVMTLGGSSYRLLMTGLGILFGAVLVAAAFLTRLTMTWSRHVARIETALQAHDIAELPALPATGERELDRIVMALNDAGQRLAQARRRADQLARQVATGERLAAIGRVAAGVAHEIRNPIAAMRLKAENTMAGDSERKNLALAMMLGQIERLDALVRRLLSMAEREKLDRAPVTLKPFLESYLSPHLELAKSKAVALECVADNEIPSFDADQMRRALDNLILNAVEAAPAGTAVVIVARRDGENLVILVHDEGSGPDAKIRDHLFEPFVTGRADGTGLGLSISCAKSRRHMAVPRA